MLRKIKRFLNCFFHLASKLDALSEKINHCNEQMNNEGERFTEASRRMDWTDKRLDEEEKRSLATDERFTEANRRMDWTDKRLDEAERIIHLIQSAEKPFLDTLINMICQRDDLLCRINKELSIRPVIWGKEDRLHISPLASVYTCILNTNSGNITVGDYTFAGSDVSILTGSHDKQLTGLLRRDAEITDGCDITIGSGVWLGSGSIILGPCSIGDNAVIAAGAVVVPRTVVPANTVWGGVPAKQIGTLNIPDLTDWNNVSVQKALERNDGILFTEGWSEKKLIPECANPGHFLVSSKGRVLTVKDRLRLVYSGKNKEKGSITVQCDDLIMAIEMTGTYGEAEIVIPSGAKTIREIRISAEPYVENLFIALYALQGE